METNKDNFDLLCQNTLSLYKLEQNCRHDVFPEESNTNSNLLDADIKGVETLSSGILHSVGEEPVIGMTALMLAFAENRSRSEGGGTSTILASKAKKMLQNKGRAEIADVGEGNVVEARKEQARVDAWEEPRVLYESPDGRYKFTMTEKEKNKFIHDIVEEIDEWLYERQFILDAEDYLQFLLNFQNRVRGFIARAAKTPWQELEVAFEKALKKRHGL
jgi:hypothetical protein